MLVLELIWDRVWIKIWIFVIREHIIVWLDITIRIYQIVLPKLNRLREFHRNDPS